MLSIITSIYQCFPDLDLQAESLVLIHVQKVASDFNCESRPLIPLLQLPLLFDSHHGLSASLLHD